jgi:hypothetical protein
MDKAKGIRHYCHAEPVEASTVEKMRVEKKENETGLRHTEGNI